MTIKVYLRLFISALVAFISYASWAYYANSLVTDDQQILIKSALVQGIYSGGITLVFTLLLEIFYKKLGSNTYCLALIIPRFNKKHSKSSPCSTVETFQAGLALSEQKCDGKCLPGELLSPLPALFIQSIMVIGVNLFFATPNLWLTVAPSIVFSAVYGFTYSFALAKKDKQARV